VSSVPPVPQPSEFARDPRLEREPAFRIPAATGWLIAVNVLVHAARWLAVRQGLLTPDRDDALVDAFGFRPDSLDGAIGGLTVLSLFTYQFLHAGWEHLAANMLTLLALGPGVERPVGRARFLALYFTCGVAGALVQAIFTPAGRGDLLIGASASISGVFGALLVIWGFHRRGRRPLGIVGMVLLWSLFLAVTGSLGVGSDGSPVAWIAHIGGFVTGIAFGALFQRYGRLPDLGVTPRS
jgi:membrane associated rhomboid family serine protease